MVSLVDIVKNGMQDSIIELDDSNPNYYVRGWEDKVDLEEIRDLHVHFEGKKVQDIITFVLTLYPCCSKMAAIYFSNAYPEGPK